MPFIESCIASVLAQDYPHMEHIIQDGASTDGTRELIAAYARKSDNIKWQSEPDRGQSDGLDRALKRSKGEILLVLNADDELLPGACAWAVEQMARHPHAAVIYGDYHSINAKGALIGKYFSPSPYHFEKVFCVEQVLPAQAAFIRRGHFEQVGFYADVTMRTAPDYEMWIRIGLRFPMKHVRGFVCRYRRHPGSEGSENSMVIKMIESKRNVIERTLIDSRTPEAIKKLGRRAHSGAIFWGAIVLLGNGAFGKSLSYVVQSVCLDPIHLIRWLVTLPFRLIRKPFKPFLRLRWEGLQSFAVSFISRITAP